MKLEVGIAGLISALSLTTGCAPQLIHDGRIPENHAARLASMEGTYEGTVELATRDRKVVRPGVGKVQIELKIRKDGEMKLSTKQDLLGEGCGSSIGKLIDFQSWDESDEQAFDANFAFDPGKCAEKVDSDQVLLASRKDIRDERSLELVLIKEYLGSYRNYRALRYHGAFKKVNERN